MSGITRVSPCKNKKSIGANRNCPPGRVLCSFGSAGHAKRGLQRGLQSASPGGAGQHPFELRENARVLAGSRQLETAAQGKLLAITWRVSTAHQGIFHAPAPRPLGFGCPRGSRRQTSSSRRCGVGHIAPQAPCRETTGRLR